MKPAVAASSGLTPNQASAFVDYKTSMVDEWIVNRKLVINATSTAIEYIQGTNSNFRLSATGSLLTVNNEIQTAVLGDGFTNALDTEITNGFGFTGDISICFYVKKPAAHSAIQILWDTANANTAGNPLFQFQTQISGGNLNMQFSYNAVNYPLTGQTFPYDNNYHVVVVRARNDAGTIKLSVNIDGTQRGAEQSVTGSMTNWDAKIARRYLKSSTTTWFGFVKRIRVYKEWLSDSTISTFLNASNAVFKQTEIYAGDEQVMLGWGQSNEEGGPYANVSLLPPELQLPIIHTNYFVDITSRLITGPILATVRPPAGPGPIIQFAYNMSQKYYNTNFYYIFLAVSNTSMASYWNVALPGTGWTELSRRLVNLLVKLKAEGRSISRVGIQDYQGEADATNLTDAGNFEANRSAFYNALQSIVTTYFPSATFQISCGRISSQLSIISYPGRDLVRAGCNNIAASRTDTTINDSDALALGPDSTHYQQPELDTIGANGAAPF